MNFSQLAILSLCIWEIFVNLSNFYYGTLSFFINFINLWYLAIFVKDFVSISSMNIFCYNSKFTTFRQWIKSLSSVTEANVFIFLVVLSFKEALAQIIEFTLRNTMAIINYVKSLTSHWHKPHLNLLCLHMDRIFNKLAYPYS